MIFKISPVDHRAEYEKFINSNKSILKSIEGEVYGIQQVKTFKIVKKKCFIKNLHVTNVIAGARIFNK